MVEWRTALRSHSRKKAHVTSPFFRTPKASGLTERTRSSWRKYLDALLGGSSCTTSHPSRGAWAARAPTKAWTAAVCSMFLRSWRLLLPETLRHSIGASASFGGDAPPLPRQGDGCAVSAGQDGQPPVGGGEASSRIPEPHGEVEALQGVDQLGYPLVGDAEQPGQVSRGHPGPVGDHVQGAEQVALRILTSLLWDRHDNEVEGSRYQPPMTARVKDALQDVCAESP